MLKKTLLLSILYFLSSFMFAQDVSPAGVSDAQIKQGIDQAKSQGYSADQLENLGKAKGLSDSDINQLKERAENLEDSDNTSESLDDAELREDFEDELDETTDELKHGKTDASGIGGRIFGQSLFKKSSLSFAPSQNIPTPKNYILSTGDEIRIDIWGSSERTFSLTIGTEGNVRIPNLGPIYISGLTIDQASDKLIRSLSKLYAGLTLGDRSSNAAHAQVSLSRVRSIKVNIVGDAYAPGTYTISAFSSLMHALYVCGGPSVNGTYRDIHVIRNNKLVNSFDIYDFLLSGNLSGNIGLEDQDIIYIPPFKSRIDINGEVRRPLIFELTEKEGLDDLIRFAHGFTDQAYKGWVTIRRLNDNSKSIITIKNRNFTDFSLQSGDIVNVAAKLSVYENVVHIAGSVIRPGDYEYDEGMTIGDLIAMAEGVSADAYKSRFHLTRVNPDLSYTNFTFSLLDSAYLKFQLNPEDFVFIRSRNELRDTRFVRIIGEVREPGVYDYVDSLSLQGLIFKAGGFKQSAITDNVDISRRIDPASNENDRLYADVFTIDLPTGDDDLKVDFDDEYFLEPYDIVIVKENPFYESQQIVSIRGEVKYPGNYALESKDFKITDLIKKAGGLTDYAFVAGARFSRVMNGEVNLVGMNFDEILKNPGEDENLSLKPNDAVYIPTIGQVVLVKGSVWQPGFFVYSENSVEAYIDASGGFDSDSFKKKLYVSYPNGKAKRTKSFLWFKNYPEVTPGATITVPVKPIKEKNGGEWIVKLLGISTSMATLALVISNISK